MCTSWAGDGGDSRAATPGVGVQKSKLGRGPSGFNSFTERRGATTRSFSGSAPSLPQPPPLHLHVYRRRWQRCNW